MSEFYDELAADALELLEELGRPVSYSRFTGTVDFVSGSATPVLFATQELFTAVLPASMNFNSRSMAGLDINFMDGLAISIDVRLALVAALGAVFTPLPGDRAAFDSRDWHVLGCTPIDVDGTPVVYVVGLEALS